MGSLSNAQMGAHKELLQELKLAREALRKESIKRDKQHAETKAALAVLHDGVEDAKQGLGWAVSAAIAVAIVYPGINNLHKYANLEIEFSGGRTIKPLVALSGMVKDAETWIAREAMHWGVERGGGDVSYIAPLAGKLRVTSGFGVRTHPVLGTRKMHNGVDYAAPVGTEVLAVQSGIAAVVSEDDAAGKYIKILHANGEVSTYMHLSVQSIEKGDAVSTGQKIGEVGSTGRSTGPHLHFGIQHSNGEYYDPVSVIGIAATAQQWEYFQDTVAASESQGNGDWAAINPLGFRGRYQMGTPALCDAGYVTRAVCESQPSGNSDLDRASSWTISGGSDAFLSSEAHQKEAYRRWQKRNLKAGRNAGVITDTTPAYKIAGFMHAAQFGVGNAIDWYRSAQDSKDGNGVSTSDYAARGERAFLAKYGRGASGATMLAAVEGTAQVAATNAAQGVIIASANFGARF